MRGIRSLWRRLGLKYASGSRKIEGILVDSLSARWRGLVTCRQQSLWRGTGRSLILGSSRMRYMLGMGQLLMERSFRTKSRTSRCLRGGSFGSSMFRQLSACHKQDNSRGNRSTPCRSEVRLLGGWMTTVLEKVGEAGRLLECWVDVKSVTIGG